MGILISALEFKGVLSASEVVEAIADGAATACPTVKLDCAPLADGGAGTVEILVSALKGEVYQAPCRDPFGRPIVAGVGILDQGSTAIIEMASCCGPSLLPPGPQRPLFASSEGVGDLIRTALNKEVNRIVVGLGGTAGLDGGSGLATALGIRLLDRLGRPLSPGGASLASLDAIDTNGVDPRIRGVSIIGGADVINPLCGNNGVSRQYGAQKGATAKEIEYMDNVLQHFASIVQRDTGVSVGDVPRTGSGGGSGAALLAFFKAQLVGGFALVADSINLERRIRNASIVVTGEGRLDHLSLYGKGPLEVARLAKRHGVPVLAICGSLGSGYEEALAEGITAAFALSDDPAGIPYSKGEALKRLRDKARTLLARWNADRQWLSALS